MSDKIRKYVLPNLPYLFVFWFFSKIGTAYRIAPGTDFGTKLMGMLDTFPKAFETYWPGLGGIDLLVGLAGAAGMYLLIQSKIRQAKKFRRDAEYGTARFGTKEDIKPFVDPKFQNNVILTGTEFLTMNTRPKIPANARNLNACVIGSSGSGKTRFWLTPQLLQAHSSYVVVDPKGGTLDQCGRFLQREKYRVRVFNSIDFSKSMHYNPLAYIKTESDVLKFVTALIANTKGDGKEGDEFWTKAETLLYCALVAYIVFEGPEEERNMNTLVEMINSMEVREDDETFKNAVDYIEADFCNTGKEGLQKLKEHEYQLVVLDVMMPGMDGFETLEEIRKENSLPILMFTSKNDSISKVRGLRAGADDYLTKPFDMDELIARIASLIRRYTRFNHQAGAVQKLDFDGLQIDLENRSVTTENGTFELPPKEFDLLLYCAKHQGKILTKQQIYEEVWGEEYFYDDSNIMAIISRLRKKLEVNPSSPKYIQTVKGIGYRFNKEV